MPEENQRTVVDAPTGVARIDDIISKSNAQTQSFLDEAGQFFEDRANPPAPAPKVEAKPEPSAKPAASKNGLADPPSDTPAAPAPVEEEIPKEFPGTDKKRKSQWEALHAKREAAEKKALELEGRIKDFEGKLATAPKANPETDAQLLALQKERDQYSELLQAVAAERHPKFQQQFQGRIASALELARQAVGAENADRIAQLLQMPDADYRNTQLEDVLSNLPTLKAGKLNAAIQQMDLISAERQHMAANGQKLYQQWTQEAQERTRASKAQIDAETAKTFEQEREAWKNCSAFVTKENDAAHNADVAQNIEVAKKIFMGQMDNQDLAKASFWAAFGQRAAPAMKTMAAENAALKAELASFKSAQPGVPGDKGEVPAVDDKDSKMSYGERMANAALNQGFMRR